ncbi:exodeoxyribonuclease V subunit gamma, partial [Chromobacterium aquaticum]|nr:exodeoxyribonuclease V subunit gamma [Chromobacterium aquaticum]
PPAALGQAWLVEEARSSVRLAARLPAALTEDTLPPQPLHLSIGGCTVVGELTGLRPEGQLSFVVGKINAAQRVALWLSHLLLCAARPAGVACRTACYDDAGGLQLEDEPGALALLEPWLARWRQGQDQPLPWFGRTGWAYAEALAAEPERRDKAMLKALEKWEPGFVREGSVAQKDEAAIALAFRNQAPLQDPLFAQLAETLLLPLAERLLDADG